MGFSSYRYENWGSRPCPPKYTVSGRDQIHERPDLPNTKFHLLYTILLSWKSQDKDSNNSLTFSSPALWKYSRNTLKLNSCINYVDWLTSKTLFPIVRVQFMAFWRIYNHPCPFTTTPLLQPIQLHFSEASCSQWQSRTLLQKTVSPKNSLSTLFLDTTERGEIHHEANKRKKQIECETPIFLLSLGQNANSRVNALSKGQL